MKDRPNLENLRIVMVYSRNPLNIGAAARAMSNFGALHLRVVTPYEKAFREAVSAVGARATSAEAEEHSVARPRETVVWQGTTAIGHREVQHEL
jgi:tRNA/rRNA methyltransferase